MHGLKLKLRSAFLSTFLRLYPQRELDGRQVVFADFRIRKDVAMQRLTEAMSLLAQTDVRYYHQVMRRVRRIIAWGGNFSKATPPATIQLCPAHLLDCSIAQLASVLVHEVVHLRIAALGVGDRVELRERVERRCIREQASFLRRQGADGALLAEAYEEALNTPWWTDDSHRKDMEISLTRAGMPRWLARGYISLFLRGGSQRTQRPSHSKNPH